MAAAAERVCIVVPGKPVPWARAFRNGARSYTPPAQVAAARAMAWAAKAAGAQMIAGPVALEVSFSYLPPKGGAAGWHPGRPDLDNLVKLVLDALTGVCWADDAQVVRIMAFKVYDEVAGTTITVGEAT